MQYIDYNMTFKWCTCTIYNIDPCLFSCRTSALRVPLGRPRQPWAWPGSVSALCRTFVSLDCSVFIQSLSECQEIFSTSRSAGRFLLRLEDQGATLCLFSHKVNECWHHLETKLFLLFEAWRNPGHFAWWGGVNVHIGDYPWVFERMARHLWVKITLAKENQSGYWDQLLSITQIGRKLGKENVESVELSWI